MRERVRERVRESERERKDQTHAASKICKYQQLAVKLNVFRVS